MAIGPVGKTEQYAIDAWNEGAIKLSTKRQKECQMKSDLQLIMDMGYKMGKLDAFIEKWEQHKDEPPIVVLMLRELKEIIGSDDRGDCKHENMD